ncbi:hypothetical protein MSG28_003736 [Choristoneura fumiferana]|uniref:Uncharacterized protein n=1 Tax=Choristoneura fumiferana TaxID=7141 RepID=A0ACC0KGE5_CHOFU|nr:hypothetical protein MSG28_003736 [Choristoneura fumiferana]
MSNISTRRREGSRAKIKVSCALWSAAQQGRSLRRLRADAAARLARGACVSPCALVLALLYLERLRTRNPHYLAAAAPAELFLMVGNKFLQDDGEDEEVICSEWAAAGNVDLADLKRLEIEFLNAIDWNVYVNEESFESGLSWLERRVALKQAQERGFFTYGDLAAAAGGAGELAAAGVACAALAAAYVATLTALLASALLASCWLPLLQAPAQPTAPAHPAGPPPPAAPLANLTVELPAFTSPEPPRCCTDWLRYQATVETERNWHDAAVKEWKSFEPWWSKTAVLTWLYRSSLVDPMQRWLERLDEYADLLAARAPAGGARCGGEGGAPRCVRQWLNLSKLGALAVSVSDR